MYIVISLLQTTRLDAKSYVQSSLDAYYHGDYKDYANLLEISEKDAKKEIEEDFNESIQQIRIVLIFSMIVCIKRTLDVGFGIKVWLSGAS